MPSLIPKVICLRVIDPWAEKLKNLNPGLKFSAEDSSWGDNGTFAEDTTTGTITTAGGTTPAYLAVSYTSISADDYDGIESGLTDPTDVAGDEDSEEIPDDASPYEHEENLHEGVCSTGLPSPIRRRLLMGCHRFRKPILPIPTCPQVQS